MKVIGVVARLDLDRAVELAEKLCTYLQEKGARVALEEGVASRLGKEGISISELLVDAIIVIGGDGTILRTCAALPNPETPILAINMGTKGLLTTIELEASYEAVDRLLQGDYVLEDCAKLAAWVNEERLPDALNEVLLVSRHMKMTLFKVWLDGEGPLTYSADGLLMSTPIGSTAHSYSAGGPVLHASLNAFVVTPICPFAPSRSLVVPADLAATIKLAKPSRIDIVIDGICRREITERETITVRLSEHKARFVRFEPASFYKRVRRKMGAT